MYRAKSTETCNHAAWGRLVLDKLSTTATYCRIEYTVYISDYHMHVPYNRLHKNCTSVNKSLWLILYYVFGFPKGAKCLEHVLVCLTQMKVLESVQEYPVHTVTYSEICLLKGPYQPT